MNSQHFKQAYEMHPSTAQLIRAPALEVWVFEAALKAALLSAASLCCFTVLLWTNAFALYIHVHVLYMAQ